MAKRTPPSRRTHGLSGTAEYRAWSGMRRRCVSVAPKDKKYYLDRGIKVCGRWQSFENFLADMGRKPSALHSLDRYPNNDGNYEPGNCRWATLEQQSLNKTSTRFITVNGDRLPLPVAVKRTGIPRSRLKRLLKKVAFINVPITQA